VKNVGAAATMRVTTSMSPVAKAALNRKARASGVSIGKFVRRSIDAYDPSEATMLSELAALAKVLERSNKEASTALDEALAAFAQTRQHLDRGKTR
jgi:hypothetical protein